MENRQLNAPALWSGESSPATLSIGSWVDLVAGLDALVKRTLLAPVANGTKP